MQAITDLIVTITYWAFGVLVLTLVLALVFGGKPSRKRNKKRKRQAKPSPLEALLQRLMKAGKHPGEAEPNQPSYESVGRLLTPAERSFYGVLLSVVPEDITVMCKVRMADLLRPNRSEIDHRTAFRKVSQKHIDFVLVRSSDLSIVAAIELNDASHQKAQRQERDQFVAHAFATASVPLLFYPACRTYLPDDVRTKVQQVVKDKASLSLITQQ